MTKVNDGRVRAEVECPWCREACILLSNKGKRSEKVYQWHSVPVEAAKDLSMKETKCEHCGKGVVVFTDAPWTARVWLVKDPHNEEG